MQKLNRCIHFDFHTPDGVYDFGEKFDAKEFARTLKNSNVTYINVAAQCNFGYAYYETKTGVMYPQMKGDLFGDILNACHNEGIGVTGYINVGLNNIQSEMHPEWCRVTKSGSIWHNENNTQSSMCYYTGYRQFLFTIIKEVVDYGADGIFLDCLGSSPCYCRKCRENMKNANVDVNDDAAVKEFAYNQFVNFITDIRKIVPENVRLTYNGPYYDLEDKLASHLEVECLPGGFGGWTYDLADMALAYARNLSDTIYMSGKFHASWGDFGGNREKASLENEMYCALVNNVGFSIGDHLHPVYGVSKSLYNTIGEIFEKLKEYEKWTHNTKHCADIAVLRNKSHGDGTYNVDELYGACRMLNELKYGFEIVNEEMDLTTYKVLILPDKLALNEKLQKKISDHIKKGGYVLSSAWAGYDKEKNCFTMPEYDFFDICGEDNDTASCYSIVDPDFGDTTEYFSDYSQGLLIKSKSEDNVIAERIDHYFKDRWDRPYFDYRATTHQYYTYLPPEKKSGYDSIVMKGNICHISFEIFACYYRYAAIFQKKLVGEILKKMLDKPLMKTEGIPSGARVALAEGEGYKLVHIKVTYPEARGRWFKVVEDHNKLPQGAKVSVKGHYNCVKLLPFGDEISFVIQGDYTVVTLPEIEGYAMLYVE